VLQNYLGVDEVSEMKDSGFQWIGMIPANWKCERGKYILEYIQKPIKENDGVITCFRDGEVTLRSKRREEGFTIADKEIGYQGIDVGDLVVHGMDGFAGAIGISDSRGKASPVLNVLDTKQNKKYIMYFLRSMAYNNVFLALATGIRVRSCDLRWNKLAELYYPIPSLDEQNRIVEFLDVKCAEIDALFKDIQTEIDILEEYKRSVITEKVTKGLNPDVTMKGSCIEWIDMIPAHWKFERGKYILKYIQKPVKENDGVITCFRDGEVTLRSKRREDGFTMADKEIGYQGIDVGDLVVHGMDGFAGAIGISDSRGKASPVLNVLNTEQNKRYVMYFLRSMAYNNVFLALATGIRVRSCDLRWNKIAELYYLIPPLKEQNKIVEYLDEKCAEIDSIIETKKEQLTVLDGYKKAIIYEYVTGKKDVHT
jgi:type I restriction enzyme S subunit